MTISALANEIVYDGDGVTVSFGVPFEFDTAADLKVFVTDTVTGAVQPLSSGFSIVGTQVVFVTAPVATAKITILDDPDLTQPTDYTNLDAFPAESHERALDRVTRLVKRLHQKWTRTLKFPDGDIIIDGTVSSTVNRRGKYLFFNLVTGALEYATAIIGQTLSQSTISQFLNPQTADEILAGVTPTNMAYLPNDARRYGATFDGATNDTTALNTTINIAKQTLHGAVGNVVNMPLGTAVIASTLTLPNDVRFQGTNKNGSILQAISTWNTGAYPFMLNPNNGASSMFDSLLQDMTVDCANIVGLGGIKSDAWQNNSGPRRCLIWRFTTYGILYANAGYAISGGADILPHEDIEVYGSDTNTPTAGIKVEQISSVGNCVLHINRAVIAGGVGHYLPRGIDIVYDSSVLNKVHFEQCTTGLYLDGIGTHVMINCAAANTVTNLVEIAATFRGSLTMIGCRRGSATNFIKDNRVGGLGTPASVDIPFLQIGPGNAYSISGITQAANAVVTLNSVAVSNPVVVGAQLNFSGAAGMTQINGLRGTVSAIGGSTGAWTATTNINSSGFSAYTSGGVVATPANRGVSAPNTASAWCTFDGTKTGTNAPNNGFNVKSVTRNSAGNYSVNFENALLASNSQAIAVTAAGLTAYSINNAGPATGFAQFIVEVLSVSAGAMVATPTDNGFITFICFGLGT